MRVSVPGLPKAILSAHSTAKVISPAEATLRLAEFISKGNVAVLTGAGVSVDSGIRAYRGDDGRYMNPNYRPIFYQDLIDETQKGYSFRQRYWLRSYLGYPPVRDAEPNTTHFALAAMQHIGIIPRIITQNVDGLHQKALAQAAGNYWTQTRLRKAVLELHGTLHHVHCNRGHSVNRNVFQTWISAANPKWKEFFDHLERTGTQPRTNPDGDVAVEGLGITYNDFVVPECPDCLAEGRRNSVQKPEVIFFGESIPAIIKDTSYSDVEKADRLLIIGTTLATYSAFRLLKHAVELKKPVMLLNVGPTRGDNVPQVEKFDLASGIVMKDVARLVVGARAEEPVLQRMLESGIVKPPPMDHPENLPRTEA